MPRNVYTADHETFRETAREFVERSLKPRAQQFIDARSIDREVWIEAGKQGLLGLEVPETYGGSEARDFRFNAILAEELSKFNAAASSCFGIHTDCVAPYLVDLGTDEQKQRWLPGFCTGEIITAIAMTEPSGGSDLAALKSTAVRDGEDWILNGSKTFITNGYQADLVVVAARTSPDKGAKGITLFGVETGMPGFERGRKFDKVGQDESDTAELFFTDVRIPGANVIGEVDRGFIAMMERLPQERVGAAVSNSARPADPGRDDRLRQGTQGLRSADRFVPAQQVPHRRALQTKLEVTQAYVDDCIEAHNERKLTAIDAAKAKWWSAQVQNDVLDACVQLYGGYGYMNEYRVARAWRDARVTKIWAGSNEIMKELIGRDLGL